MRLPRPTLEKLQDVIQKPAFRQSPMKVISRITKWQIIRLFKQPIVFNFDNSIWMKLYPDDDDVATRTYYYDYHEPKIFNFLHRYLKEGMTYVDVGANIGVYTLFAAKRVGTRGKVFAFEPQQTTFSRLTENIKISNLENITAEQVAVGAQSGEIEIVTDENYSSISYTKHIDSNNKTKNVVKVITLDAYFEAKEVKDIDYLKIDVEGFEFYVLLGAKEILKTKIPAIIQVELIERFQKRSGSSTQMICQLLNELGYHLFYLEENSLKPAPPYNQKKANDKIYDENDILAIHGTKIQHILQKLEMSEVIRE